ncbi:hypothetical protein NC651_012809 [Populus alba x Populus x berolinensis]|nr:hypothetical protein NC651_012809 [Populus alba x Populus x berolinensis]
MANLGLVYYMFLVGLEIDPRMTTLNLTVSEAMEAVEQAIRYPSNQKEVETRWCERILLSELHVNQNLLTKAPCSVGVIVDRGLKSEILDKGNLGTQQFNVTMLVTGGPDNREALA